MPEAGRVDFASEHDEQTMTMLGLSSKREVTTGLWPGPVHLRVHGHDLGAHPSQVAFGHAPVEADRGEVIGHEIACPVQRGDQHSVGPDPGREVSARGVSQHPVCSRPIATSTTARWGAKCERSAASATEATGACPGVAISASL
jgi:hypothetical protein